MFEFVKKLSPEKLELVQACDCLKTNQFTTERGVYNIYILRHKLENDIWYFKLKDDCCVELVNLSKIPFQEAKRILSKDQHKARMAKIQAKKDPEETIRKAAKDAEDVNIMIEFAERTGVLNMKMSRYQEQYVIWLFKHVTNVVSFQDDFALFDDGTFLDYDVARNVVNSFLEYTKRMRDTGVRANLLKFQQKMLLSSITSLAKTTDESCQEMIKHILDEFIKKSPITKR